MGKDYSFFNEMIDLWNSIDEVIYVSDFDTYEILFMNQFMIKAFGNDFTGDICHKSFQNLDKPCSFCTNDIIRNLKDHKTDKHISHNWAFHNINVNRFYKITDKLIRWKNGKDVRFEIAIDTTEHLQLKEKTEELRRNEALLEGIINNTPSVIFVKDVDGKFLKINKQFESLFQVKQKEVINKTDHDIFDKNMAEQFRANDLEIIKNGQMSIEEVAPNPDGKIHTYISEKFTLYNEDSIPYAVCGIATDITKRKEIEIELERYKNSLEVLVEKKTIEIANKNETLEELNKSLIKKTSELLKTNKELEQFAFIATHDLKEPLRLVISYLQIIDEEYSEKLDEEGKEYIWYAVDGAKRLRALIEHIRIYSTINTDNLAIEPVDIEVLIEKMMEKLSEPINEAGIKIINNPLPTIKCSSSTLTQIFKSLITNSIRFRSDKAPEIEIKAKKDNDNWIFSVRDNGIGVKPEYHDNIFIIFKRLNAISQYEGSGVGLAICKKLVEGIGGKIWIESEYENGATFFFSVPINEGEIV